MLSAVRTVEENDDFRIIEGLAYPFRGRDTYGTFFSARTNYHWDLFPDVIPTATRAEAPLYIRPTTFHHGFDPDFGLARVGGWSPVRMDADGIWVQQQINKRQDYYATRLGPLLDAGALGLSGGSAEHSVRIDQRTGEVLDWPAYELALTPVESNPLAVIASRSGEMRDALRIVSGAVRAGAEYEEGLRLLTAAVGPVDAGNVAEALRIVDETPRSRTGVRFHSVEDVQGGTYILADLTRLIASEADEPDQLALLQSAADNVSAWLDLERAEIGESGVGNDDEGGSASVDVLVVGSYSTSDQGAFAGNPWLSGTRAGKRNSATDEAALLSAHDGLAYVLDMDCAPGDASARAAEGPPAIRLVPEVERPDVTLAEMATRAATSAAEEAVRRLTG